jgi:hypothetical protein
MTILLGCLRPRRRGARPSVREVRLLGGARPGPGWASGEQVTLSGRSYRVAATQARGDDAPRYVHLADDEGATGRDRPI